MNYPNCTLCKHYFITLDERLPKGCRVFNIKGRNMPSIDVSRMTGHKCPVFSNREKKSVSVIKEFRNIDTSA